MRPLVRRRSLGPDLSGSVGLALPRGYLRKDSPVSSAARRARLRVNAPGPSMWRAGLRLGPRLTDGASWAPPALHGHLRFTHPGTDCGRHIRPPVASVATGPHHDSLS